MNILIHKVHRSKISVEKLMNQSALNLNNESTQAWTRPLTNKSNNDLNNTKKRWRLSKKLWSLYEYQIMKKSSILVATAGFVFYNWTKRLFLGPLFLNSSYNFFNCTLVVIDPTYLGATIVVGLSKLVDGWLQPIPYAEYQW